MSTSSILQTLGKGQGFLKAGFLGLNKSGKSYTSILLALTVREMFNLKGPIGFYDSEGGSEYVAPIVRAATGLDLVGLRSQSFSDLVDVTTAAAEEGVAALVCDVTQPWRELCKSYLAQVNEARSRQSLLPRNRLTMGDWNVLKGTWNEQWASLYVNSKIHLIANGRAGFEWDFEEDSDGQTQLVKTGLKMKSEGEFGFEPSLLVEMEQLHQFTKPSVRRKDHKAKAGVSVIRAATVLGDRFGAIDGAYTTFTTEAGKFKEERDHTMTVDLKKLEKEIEAVRRFFGPHLRLLTPGAYAPVDTRMKTDLGVTEGGDASYRNEIRGRKILAEEIEAAVKILHPRQTDADKTARLELFQEIFGVRSWTAIEETVPIQELREGLADLRTRLNPEPTPIEAVIGSQNGGAQDGDSSLQSASNVS